MKFLPMVAELFYSPLAFFRLRKDSSQIFYFLSFFYLISFIVITANLAWLFNIRLNFLQFFFLVLFFYLIGFIKTALFSAFLNTNKPIASLKEVWLINSVSMYPIFIFIPLGAVLGHWKGVFLVIIIAAFVYVNYLRSKMFSSLYSIKPKFVLGISLIEILFGFALIFVVAGMSYLFIFTFMNELFNN